MQQVQALRDSIRPPVPSGLSFTTVSRVHIVQDNRQLTPTEVSGEGGKLRRSTPHSWTSQVHGYARRLVSPTTGSAFLTVTDKWPDSRRRWRWGAKRGASAHRRGATQGDVLPRIDAVRWHIRRHSTMRSDNIIAPYKPGGQHDRCRSHATT